jgi:transmembrane sensor
MDQKLLDKFLNHQATEQDIQSLKGDPETAELVTLSQQVTELKYKGFEQQKNWRVIQNHIKQKSSASEKSNDGNVLARLFKLSPAPEVIWRFAAVFVLALGTYFFLSPNNIDLVTPAGTHQIWTLPDGSEISLNAASKASYDPESWNKDRIIELEGEAFFDVTKGSTFSVNTSSGVITVLGTEFNVKVREHQFYVHCFEGLVKVQTADTLLMLSAGNGMRIEDGLLVQDRVTQGARPDWIRGESSFDDAPLTRVLDELARQYDITITYQGELASMIDSALFKGSFTHQDLQIALKSICHPFGLDFELTDGAVILRKN